MASFDVIDVSRYSGLQPLLTIIVNDFQLVYRKTLNTVLPLCQLRSNGHGDPHAPIGAAIYLNTLPLG